MSFILSFIKKPKIVYLPGVTRSRVYVVLYPKHFGLFRTIIREKFQGIYNILMVLRDGYDCTITQSFAKLPDADSKQSETCSY